ncbi:hypothetical protein HDU98_005063, partial [Podochytrium sp. JEL0797]
MVNPTATLRGLKPSKFVGQTSMDFDRYVRIHLMPYAKFLGVAAAFADGYAVGIIPVAPVPLAAFPNPGALAAGATAAQRAHWDMQWKLYTHEASTNTTAHKDFVESRKRYEDRFEKNDKAIAALTECFSSYDMSRVQLHVDASVKLSTLRNLYNFGGLHGASGTQWQALFHSCVISHPQGLEEVCDFVARLSELVTSHQEIYPDEAHHLILLDLLCSKLNIVQPAQKEFAGLALRLSQNGTDSFQPALIPGVLPAGAAPAAVAPMVPGPHHYGISIARFINAIQNACSTMMTNAQLSRKEKGKSAQVFNGPPSFTGEPSRQWRCSFHKIDNHSDADCRDSRNPKSGRHHPGTSQVRKTSPTSQVGKNVSKCRVCSKTDHTKLKDCPVAKKVFSHGESSKNHSAKAASVDSDGNVSMIDATAVSLAVVPFGLKQSAAHARDVLQGAEILSGSAQLARAFVASSADRSHGQRTILDSGASRWMTPFKEDFVTLQLINNGGVVNIADNTSLRIEGHGMVNLRFGDYEHFMDALYVPGLAEPLGSVTSLLEGTNNSVSFDKDTTTSESATGNNNDNVGDGVTSLDQTEEAFTNLKVAA